MKSLYLSAALLLAAIIAGCVTSKVSQVDPATGATNTVTAVNTNNLALDASVLQLVTAVGVGLAVDQDPSIVPTLKTAQIAIDGILHGTSTQTTQEVIDMLKASDNPTLSREVAILLKTVSSLEQNLLVKYGTSNGGQISLAILSAIDVGLSDALTGK